MKKYLISKVISLLILLFPLVANAHTNSVGFKISPSAVTTCIGGGSPCYDVEIFYGSWHSGSISAEGDLALWLQSGGGETQVVGQSASGGTQIPFTTSHSLVGTLPNSSPTALYNYSTVGSADYNNLLSVFNPGTDYFFSNYTSLMAVPDGSVSGVYAHQSAVAVGLGPGSYRIAYDAATSGGLSATWSPVAPVQTAIFTLSPNGSVVVPSAPPSVVLSTATTTYSGPFTVTATFSKDITGLSLADFVVSGGTVSSLVNVSPGVYTVLVTPDGSGGPITVDLPSATVQDSSAQPNSASNQLALSAAPPPTTPFTPAVKDELRNLIVGEATRDLQNQMGGHLSFTRGARDRFIAAKKCRQLKGGGDRAGNPRLDRVLQCDDDRVSRNNVPFDVDGRFVATSRGANLVGNFFGQNGAEDGSGRRLVYGEFDLTGYDNGSVIGTLSGRVAWEHMISGSNMLGYFVGADLTRSNINSTFSGARDTLGLNFGAYYVEDIGKGLVGDAFVALGVGMNNLDVGNGVVDVTSQYQTASAQAGASISGEVQYDKFTLSPEISMVYGVTRIGDVGVTGSGIGVSGTDTIVAGTVRVGEMKLTPRFEIPLEMSSDTYDEKQLTVSPRVICRIVKTTSSTTDCGAGLDLELVAKTFDSTRRVGGRVSYQSVGGEGQGNLALFYERAF